MRKKKKFNRIRKGILVLAFSLLCGAGRMPLFAYAQGEEAEGTAGENTAEPSQTENSPAALTPEGNLTLVDDYGDTAGEGKEFLTFVTKSGNYFYLIVDRDAKGDSTVHLLNQVDEADLLALMDGEEIEKYEAEKESREAEAQAAAEAAASAAAAETETQPGEEAGTAAAGTGFVRTAGAAFAWTALLGGGGLCLIFFLGSRKKKKKPVTRNRRREDYNYELEEEDDWETDSLS